MRWKNLKLLVGRYDKCNGTNTSTVLRFYALFEISHFDHTICYLVFVFYRLFTALYAHTMSTIVCSSMGFRSTQVVQLANYDICPQLRTKRGSALHCRRYSRIFSSEASSNDLPNQFMW